MLRKLCLCLAPAAAIALTPADSVSGGLTELEALLIGSTAEHGQAERFWGMQDAHALGALEGDASDLGLSGYDPPRGGLSGVIGVHDAFGVVLDYSNDLPRVRGIAFSPNRHVRFEARGQIDPGLDSMGGRVSVHFNF